jgi:hypothetical protein
MPGKEVEGGKEDKVGSMASLHYVQIIYNIYSSLDIYQKGHHLKNKKKSSNIKATLAANKTLHWSHQIKSKASFHFI